MIFSASGKQPEQLSIGSYVITTNCQFYSNISQILLLCKTSGNYNKFDSMKSLKVYHWYVKIPQSRYMEHGLKDIKCYVQKHIAPWALLLKSPSSLRVVASR